MKIKKRKPLIQKSGVLRREETFISVYCFAVDTFAGFVLPPQLSGVIPKLDGRFNIRCSMERGIGPWPARPRLHSGPNPKRYFIDLVLTAVPDGGAWFSNRGNNELL